ncbi:MAG: hypothetical protein QY326_05565 [Bdellovibrionota bacterium]|nr:MAG: hypothetical protein QY326_05565 [Bdellovibrionota bacterium]
MATKRVSERGCCLVEYAMLIAVIAIVSVSAVESFGSYVDCRYNKSRVAFNEAGGGTEGAEGYMC